MLYCRRALRDFEKGVIFLQESYQLWSPTGQRLCFQNNAPVGRHPDHTMAPFAAGVNPVRNSSGALNPVRDLSLNGINPALRGGTRNFSKIYPHPYILAFPIAINQPCKVYN